MDLDILLKNGWVVDGSGNPWFKANVGIKDGHIVAIGRGRLGEGRQVINAENLVVAPGFINPHGHMDRFLHEDNAVLQSVMQGLTVECTGNCGMAIYTMSENYRRYLQEFSEIPVDWRTLQEWRRRLETKGLGLNVAPFLGFGTIRSSVMGEEGEGGERFKPTAEELDRMKALAIEGMEDGAFGITVGLSYQVQRNAST